MVNSRFYCTSTVRSSLLLLLNVVSPIVAASPRLQSRTKAPGVGVLDVRIPASRSDDNYYVIDVDFQGQSLPVLLDTGSADVFVATTACSTTNETSGCYKLREEYEIDANTNIVSNQSFYTIVGEGPVQGNVSLMDIGMGDITAPDLAIGMIYFAVRNEFQQGSFAGIAGLSMLSLSRLNASYGYQPLIDKLVSTNAIAQPLFSVSAPRYADPASEATGKLTLGAIEERYAERNITYSEIIDSQNYNIPGYPYVPQGWAVLLQGLRVNGVSVNLSQGSIDVDGRYMSLFDSGSSDILVRPTELQAIADNLKGKVIYQNLHDVYFECAVPQLIELRLNDQWIPINPLDLVVPREYTVINGTEMCRAALGSWSRTFADSILGAPFFRSAFTVYDYVSVPLYAQQPRVGVAPLVDARDAVAKYPDLWARRLKS